MSDSNPDWEREMKKSLLHDGLRALAALVLVFGLQSAFAQPEHDCEEPEKPESFENQDQYDEFIESAQEYMDCLKDFYDEQAEASRLAAEAANAARAEMEAYAASINQ